jgi:REP element-mobilizing transposase RayT
MRSPAAFRILAVRSAVASELSFAQPDSRGRLSPREQTMPKAFYRRELPHLQRDDKPHLVTFCTYLRWRLPEPARLLVLESCVHDNDIKIHLHAAVVMPDHVHLVFTPLINAFASQVYSIAEIMDAIKGALAHKINQALGRRGKVWQTESFDRVLRSPENLDAKIIYILENPVRAGLDAEWERYPWLWYRGSRIHMLPSTGTKTLPPVRRDSRPRLSSRAQLGR